MSKLKIHPTATRGRIVHVTPASAGWKHVGFDLWALKAGDEAVGGETGRESCLVFIAGKGHVFVEEKDFGVLGGRNSPFEGKPWSVYAPGGARWRVVAENDLTLAVCTAPGEGRLEARVIKPDGLHQETRGKSTNTRHVTNIIPEWEPAEGLLVVEVITPGGCTSSYPPHKHDTDNLPHESFLEETYYHRINPPQGFAFQRVYTDDRSLDETMAVEDGDVTLVPKGYHPCATTHGYDLYYLNVMAGPRRTWKFHNAEEHAWLLKA
ncbi:5-deoxy-glucuronate isomerase [Aestuariivirga sp.]|jgi:5-deoxy-glucuronate isomerase|uniref:5-deoxy-glucuronate isomerase n=1 Tax=Aestuariivirga sp. TaxID=2650926 RepID=UPI003782FCA6